MSKRVDQLNDLRTKTPDQLEEDLRAAKEALFKLRFRHATNELENTTALRQTRRSIARINTVLGEKRRAG